MARDVRDNEVDPVAFQMAVIEKVESGQPATLVNPAVSEVIAQANAAAQHKQMDPAPDACVRNWAVSCPDGWSASGSTCSAPAGYGGACQRFQSFAESTDLGKSKFAADCKAPWPCQDECDAGRDYAQLCPSSWKEIGDGFCSAPAEAGAKCATMYKFDDMTVDAKQDLAITCSFSWPCKVSCDQDYSSACPEGWTETMANLCMAPADYAGECEYSIDTAQMTASQKLAFANKCAVVFPCTKGFH